MTTTASHVELSSLALGAMAKELRTRPPRQAAEGEIEIRPIPLRTCYETMMRLTGPRDAVLDYAAYLFAEEGKGQPAPVPPLTIEEGQIEPVTGTISLLLSRGSYTPG